MNTVQEDVHNIRTTSQAIGQSTYQAMEQVGDKLRDLTGMSTEQSSTLNAILELLKQQIPVNTRNDDAGTSLPAVVTHDLTEAKEERNEASNDDDLHAALDRLCQFAKEKERTVFSAEAESIILDIAELLSFLLEADEGVKNVQSRKKIRGGSNGFANKEDRDLQYRKEVKNIKNLIDASHCVAINGKGISGKLCKPSIPC